MWLYVCLLSCSIGVTLSRSPPVHDDINVDMYNLNAFALLNDRLNDVPYRSSDDWVKFNQSATRNTREGRSTDTHLCDQVGSVPTHLTFIRSYNHYQKYTHAYDIPIVSTNRVSDAALKRACYVVRFLMADRPVLRQHLYKHFGRVGIMAQNEGTTSIPEHRHLGSWWDKRARGLGGTLHIPISTGAEENLLCLSGDRYSNEDIFLHEFSHGIQEIAIRGGGIPGYFARLQSAYASARSRGLWRNTYSMSTVQEYFAEGVQSFFHVNAFSKTPNGVHNHVNTRAKLRSYDVTLYRLLKEVFPCGNFILDRCKKGSQLPTFKMNCDGTKPTVTATMPLKTTAQTTTLSTKNGCIDKAQHCSYWLKSGYCTGTHEVYMRSNCCQSCCSDAHANCDRWKQSGFCLSYRTYMEVNCKRSCGGCRATTSPNHLSPPNPN